MDEIVKQAMAKWPNVPDCYGWLGLDERGRWYLRDDSAQALGGFASGVSGAKGEWLRHDKLVEFIQRNYDHDADGQWFFQNGPQRVFVELQAAPWVWRVARDGTVTSHAGGAPVQVREVLSDESGRVYMATDQGLGLVHTQDTGVVADALEDERWPLRTVAADDLPQHYGFVLSPEARRRAR